MLPVAQRPMTTMPAFAATAATASECFWLVTAYLSFSQAVVVRSRPMLLFATGVLAVASFGLAYVLAYPGIVWERGILSNAQTAPWLAVFSRVVFLVLVAAYVYAGGRTADVWRRGRARRYAVGGPLAVVLLTLLAVLPGALPPLESGTALTVLATHLILPGLIAGCAAAVVYLAVTTRLRTVLDLWLCVVLLAALLETAVSAAGGARYTLGWALGRIEGTLEAAALLAVFLFEVSLVSRRLAMMAAHDAVSGLANRRALDERLDALFAGRRRRADVLSLIMLDVDHFKTFNDRHGHAAGDECLRTIGTVVRRALVRSQDFAARYGGEEFVVVLPATDRAGAIVVAERIRSDVERVTFSRLGGTPRVTVSLGVVTVPPHKPASVERVLQLADRAMYGAKAAGRNCIVEAGSSETGTVSA